MAPHIRLRFPEPVLQSTLDAPVEWTEEDDDWVVTVETSSNRQESSRPPIKGKTDPSSNLPSRPLYRDGILIGHYSSSCSSSAVTSSTSCSSCSSRASSPSRPGHAAHARRKLTTTTASANTQAVAAQRCEDLRQSLRKALLLEFGSDAKSEETNKNAITSKWVEAPDSFYAAFLRFAAGPSSGESSDSASAQHRKQIGAEPRASRVAFSRSLPTPGSLGFKGRRLPSKEKVEEDEEEERCTRSRSAPEHGICRSASDYQVASANSSSCDVPSPTPTSPSQSDLSSFSEGDLVWQELEQELLLSLELRTQKEETAASEEASMVTKALSILLRFVKLMEEPQSQGLFDVLWDQRRTKELLNSRGVVAMPPSVVDAGGCRVILVMLRHIARCDPQKLAQLVGLAFLQLCADPSMNAKGVCMIYDISGVTIQDACKLLRLDFARICPHGCFPLRTRRLVIANQPQWFGLLWRSVQRALNHKRRSQIHLVGEDLEALERIVPNARSGVAPFLGSAHVDGRTEQSLVESWYNECATRGHLLSWLKPS